VSSILLVKATIVNVERRKVSIQVELMDPSDDTVHAEGEGLVVMNKGVLPGH
jgi:predicted thioesterase